jgi:hypothetical protein
MAHSLDRCEVSVMILFKHTEPYMCEVSVMIPFEHTEPWSGSIIGSEPDPGVEMMEHIALTSPCEDRLAATYGSSALRPYPTSTALTFTPG